MRVTGKVVLPDRVIDPGWVEFEGGVITAVGEGGGIRESSVWIVPGFIDIHVHGGGGADYMDGTAEAVATANLAHLRHGTTTVFPTTATGTPEQVRRMIEACGVASVGARIAGVHLYGPFFAECKVGCHSASGRRDPAESVAEYEGYFATGRVKIATCAAELPGAEAFYRAAAAAGCLVTCGHSDASWTDMERAFAAGMRHVDHFWCAMSSVASLRARHGTPMQASMEQFVLANPEMSTEVIADGEHLSRELLEFAWRMKGPKRLCLVTDANRALDMPPGLYRFGAVEDGPWLESNGRVGFVPGTGSLASSVVALDTMVRNMARMTPAPMEDVIRMATLTPAERAGIASWTGSLEAGKRADIVVLDEDLRVREVYQDGVSRIR